MDKIYNIRIPKEDHKDLKEFCEALNTKLPAGLPHFKPETLAQFILLRNIDLLNSEMHQVDQFALLFAPIFHPKR
ncbi:hypothetical protein [Frigidibacter sp.]|uniref:hypothetical protein n=1 Tax=Frigidibacter sp. TaxID=2586418 RepID=UPI0027362090|nr:hypothetical protein [Frigidibacter sp.]MDP3342824.1 hypothetical protein [Frigidibacter sp.]